MPTKSVRILLVCSAAAGILTLLFWLLRPSTIQQLTHPSPDTSSSEIGIGDSILSRVEVIPESTTPSHASTYPPNHGELLILNRSGRDQGTLTLRGSRSERLLEIPWIGAVTSVALPPDTWIVDGGPLPQVALDKDEITIVDGDQTVCRIFHLGECRIVLSNDRAEPLANWSVAAVPYLDDAHQVPTEGGKAQVTDMEGVVKFPFFPEAKALIVATDGRGSAIGSIVDFSLQTSISLILPEVEAQFIQPLPQERITYSVISLVQVQTGLTFASARSVEPLQFGLVGALNNLAIRGEEIHPIDLPPISQLPDAVKARRSEELEILLGDEWVAKAETVTVQIRRVGFFDPSASAEVFDYHSFSLEAELTPSMPSARVFLPGGAPLELRAFSNSSDLPWTPLATDQHSPLVLTPVATSEPLAIELSGVADSAGSIAVKSLPLAEYPTDAVVVKDGERWIVHHPERVRAIEVTGDDLQRVSLLPMKGYQGSLGGQLQLHLHRGALVQGTVIDASTGLPLSGWHLDFRAIGNWGLASSHPGWTVADQPREFQVATGTDGRFIARGLGTGNYQVYLRPQPRAYSGSDDYFPFNLSLPIAGDLLFRVPRVENISLSAIDAESGTPIPAFTLVSESYPSESKQAQLGVWQGALFNGCYYRVLAFGYAPLSFSLADIQGPSYVLRLQPVIPATLVFSAPTGFPYGAVQLKMSAVRDNQGALEPLGFSKEVDIVSESQEVAFPANNSLVFLDIVSVADGRRWTTTPRTLLWKPGASFEITLSSREANH